MGDHVVDMVGARGAAVVDHTLELRALAAATTSLLLWGAPTVARDFGGGIPLPRTDRRVILLGDSRCRVRLKYKKKKTWDEKWREFLNE